MIKSTNLGYILVECCELKFAFPTEFESSYFLPENGCLVKDIAKLA